MEFWVIVCSVALLFWLYPWLRCFVKRMIGARKLTRVCRERNYRLHKTHPLWILGHKHSERCDFYVETPNTVYAVKLFGVPQYRSMLVLREGGEYFIRSLVSFVSWLPLVKYDWDYKPKAMPRYDFRCGYREEWEIKTPRNILLIHPVAMEVRFQSHTGQEMTVGSGNVVNGMEIQSMSRFLGELKK